MKMFEPWFCFRRVILGFVPSAFGMRTPRVGLRSSGLCAIVLVAVQPSLADQNRQRAPEQGPEAPVAEAPVAEAPASRVLDAWLDELSEAEVRAQCEHERAARASEAALLRSPWVAARGSTLQRNEFASGPDDPLYVRVRAGAGMSLDEWMRAGLLDEYAEQRCAVYRAQTRLRSESASLEAVVVEGWKAQAEHLHGAVAKAQRLLERSSVELEQGRRTVTEHLRVLSDVDRLGHALATADEQVARVVVQRSPEPVDEAAIGELRSSVAALEQVEGRLRRNRALALSIEAGYDEIIGVPQRLPLYGQVNLTFRPGYFWQSAADDRSSAARSRAVGLHAQRARSVVGRAIHQARSQLQSGMVAEARLIEVIRTLERQRNLLVSVQNEDAQLVVERLWFELQLQQAKLVRLRASRSALEQWLRAVGSEPTPVQQDSVNTTSVRPAAQTD